MDKRIKMKKLKINTWNLKKKAKEAKIMNW